MLFCLQPEDLWPKGSTSAIVQPKQEQDLFSLVAITVEQPEYQWKLYGGGKEGKEGA